MIGMAPSLIPRTSSSAMPAFLKIGGTSSRISRVLNRTSPATTPSWRAVAEPAMHADVGSTKAPKCSIIPVAFPNLEHGVRRTLPIIEHGVITLMVVGCLSIAASKDQGSSGFGGEAHAQDQGNNQAGGTRSQQGSKGSGGETPGQGPVRTACRSEIERLCPGEESAGRCLRSHSPDQLSEACRAALANRGSR